MHSVQGIIWVRHFENTVAKSNALSTTFLYNINSVIKEANVFTKDYTKIQANSKPSGPLIFVRSA